MVFKVIFACLFFALLLRWTSCHGFHGHEPHVMTDRSPSSEREHIAMHLEGVAGHSDINKMAEEELRFHYFKMHDEDGNNKLDGRELIASLVHWHVEESQQLGHNTPTVGTTKIFTDTELCFMIDPILAAADKNSDGFIDYPEYIADQEARGF